jgi:hypothetical protein
MDASEPSTPVSMIFAHSLLDRPIEEWEPLSHHLTAVGNRAAEFAEAFGWKEAARVAGQLHDWQMFRRFPGLYPARTGR